MRNVSEIAKRCCGCAACEQACPKQCIQMRPDAEGFLFPQIDGSRCVDCGACVRHCPIVSLQPAGNTPKVFAAKSNDSESLQKSTSGGVFPLLAKQMIKQGGVVFGCAFDDKLHARHIAARTEEELTAFYGSKYVQSDLRGIYKQVRQELQQGTRVLFSGTGCQIAGLKSFLGSDHDKLLTVDVICHGVPSPLLFEKYMQHLGKQYGGAVTAFTFRCKEPHGWSYYFKAETAGKTKVGHAHFDPYYSAFIEGKISRESCFDCPCASTDRHADITLGDFWGIEEIDPAFYDKNGVSLVLINTPKGEKAFREINPLLQAKPQQLADAVKKNGNLQAPTKRPPSRDTAYRGIDGDFEAYVKTNLKIHDTLKKRLKMLIPSDAKRKVKQIIKH